MYKDEGFQSRYSHLREHPKSWLITGCAGFIGSHIAEALLELGQRVVGLDNFSTGSRSNIEAIVRNVGAEKFSKFVFIEGDIRSVADCGRACHALGPNKKIDVVLHQAALGSVPRSIQDPETTNSVNVGGFVTLINLVQKLGINRFVFASSSSVYGAHPELPRRESQFCQPLSPYASSKLADEIYARAFSSCFGLTTVGLRYFNVFGPRQNPQGPYAAVIPLWVKSLIKNEDVFINGDGETSRDFCFVQNVVEANILSACKDMGKGSSINLNIGCGNRTTLNQLHEYIISGLARITRESPVELTRKPKYLDFRPGDVRHSHADISVAESEIGYRARVDVREGLNKSIDWYYQNTL